ncbi:MAG TPA: hypothetical protein VME46_13335 [Acidimicrobiales bacterium]|nr:hypothetical protein [Acidimicrobiales bacterium]
MTRRRLPAPPRRTGHAEPRSPSGSRLVVDCGRAAKAYGAVLDARLALTERLRVLAEALRVSGRYKAAIATASEARSHLRLLARADPARFTNELVIASAHFASCLAPSKSWPHA